MSVVNSIINKTLNTPSITVNSNDVNETTNGVNIYFVLKVVHWLNPAFIKSNQVSKKEQSINFRVLHDVTKTDFCST